MATKIIEILKKHMKEPRDDISLSTQLTDLKIESLDLAMIVFDIEDTFGIEIPYNANEDVEDLKTVGSVVDRVKALMAGGPAANRELFNEIGHVRAGSPFAGRTPLLGGRNRVGSSVSWVGFGGPPATFALSEP